MEKTPFQKWLDGRFLNFSDPVDTAEVAWSGALFELRNEILRQHAGDNPVVKNILKIIEAQGK